MKEQQMTTGQRIACDAFGCDETHPLNHEFVGQPSFGLGKFLGWVYLDINRPELADRQLRFCSLRCMLHWLGMNAACSRAIDSRVGPEEVQFTKWRIKA